MSRMRVNPSVSMLFFIAVLVFATAAVAQDPDCHNGTWGPTEFCGFDASAATGETEMNHDCVLDFLDLTLMSLQVGLTGFNLSGDFDENLDVNLADINNYFAPSYYSGNPVEPCESEHKDVEYCGANLSLSLDPGIIVSRGRETVTAPFPWLVVYVVASEWTNAGAIEYAVETSSNVAIQNHMFVGDWTGLDSASAGATYYYCGNSVGFPQASTTVVAELWVTITGPQPATIDLVDYGGSAPLRKTRWGAQNLVHSTNFVVRRNLGINGIDHISTTTSACQSSNNSPTLDITDPLSDIQVSSSTTSYPLSGLATDTDGNIALIEYRVNDGPWQQIDILDPWPTSVDLVVGENWIQVRTADNEGAYSSTQVVTIERLEPPDLAVIAWSGPDILTAGCLLSDVSVTVKNISSVNAPVSELGFYLSTDADIDPSGDYLVAPYPVPALLAGESIVINTTITIPDDGPRGSVHLGAFVDHDDAVVESDETNNTDSSPLEYPIPAINSILDVENDQGRAVRINLLGSSRDVAGSTTPILQYEAFRRIDPLLAGADRKPALDVQGTQISDSPKQAGWEFVGAIPAHGYSEYNMIAPTLADKTDEGTHWSVFFVRAATAQPLVFFDSCSGSGYSEDNLAPCTVKSLTVAYASGGNQLSWEPSLDDDFRNFRIYRGSSPGFVPDVDSLVESTIGTEWLDTVSDPWDHYYKITAVDHSGNESEIGLPVSVSGVQGSSMPSRTVLLGAIPNPFNPETRLPFEMAAAGHVQLKVFDTAGRLVATLVDENRDAGRHHVVWDGRDNSGRVSSAGVYLYRLEVDGYSETKRMVLVK